MSHAGSIENVQDDSFQTILDQAVGGSLDVALTRELDLGEKAPDALDFEDISDTDLAAEEDTSAEASHGLQPANVDANTADHAEQILRPTDLAGVHVSDDLFEEDIVQASEIDQDGHNTFIDGMARLFRGTDKLSRTEGTDGANHPASKEEQLQQELFARSRASVTTDFQYPEPPENSEELLKALWPKFQKDAIPRFMELLPPNKARYLARSVPKPPRVLNPTRLSLVLTPDCEKSFRSSLETHKRSWQEMSQTRLVPIVSKQIVEDRSEHNSDDEAEYSGMDVAQISQLDLEVLCEDWELQNDSGSESDIGFSVRDL